MFFIEGLKTKNPALLQDLYCLFLAGKEGQTSNLNVQDLEKVLDFIDLHRLEIDALKKEPEITQN